jgi:hypothetical protein
MRKPSRTILDLREWIGATQEEMGDLLGMGRSAIALCERIVICPRRRGQNTCGFATGWPPNKKP